MGAIARTEASICSRRCNMHSGRRYDCAYGSKACQIRRMEIFIKEVSWWWIFDPLEQPYAMEQEPKGHAYAAANKRLHDA